MKWSDIPFNPGRKVLRQFAALWLICLLALGASQYLAKGRPQLGLALAAAALIIGLPGLIWPRLLRALYAACLALTFPIGWLITQLMLLTLYFVVLTPVAVFFRIRGRDLLGRKPASKRNSFWEPKQTPRNLSSYFRQY